VTRFTGGFNRFVTSTVAPVASGWSSLPGGTLTHWESAALPRRTPGADMHRLLRLNGARGELTDENLEQENPAAFGLLAD